MKIFLIMITLFASTVELANQAQPLYLFSHGLANNKTQVQAYIDAQLLPPNTKTFNYPHGRQKSFLPKKIPVLSYVSLAQQYDIDALAKQYDFWQNHLTQLNRNCIVGFGISNGASTWINFVAQQQPQNIAALILESLFDHTASIAAGMQNAIQQHLSIRIKQENIDSFMKGIFREYDPQGIQTIELVAQLPHDLPILLVCSATDERVPAKSTINLYEKLKSTGHKNVHLLVLTSGQHDKLITNLQTQSIYVPCTHAFYKYYNLPYNKNLAQRGEKVFSLTQP